jgi:hypothetical protein
MINMLLCNAKDERRLFVAVGEDKQPSCAPMLIKTIEQSELDLLGKPETQRKGKGDLSHPGAALRYALWNLERPRREFLQVVEGGLS